MAVRHRIPTIFSIYMVDVLCCAWAASSCCGRSATRTPRPAPTSCNGWELERLKSARMTIASLSSEVSDLKVSLDWPGPARSR